jgi:hypothetical protein
VGLGHNSCPHPLGNNNEFHALTPNPNASGLARRDLIATLLEFNLEQDIVVSQRFGGLSNALPQTGHTLWSGLTIKFSLHLGHLRGWTLTRLTSVGSRLAISLFLPRFLRIVGPGVIWPRISDPF